MPKKVSPEIEYRISDLAGFVYLTEDDRVLWSRQDEEIQVNNHSNWGTVSSRQHEAAAEVLRKAFPGKTVKKVLNITYHDERKNNAR